MQLSRKTYYFKFNNSKLWVKTIFSEHFSRMCLLHNVLFISFLKTSKEKSHFMSGTDLELNMGLKLMPLSVANYLFFLITENHYYPN